MRASPARRVKHCKRRPLFQRATGLAQTTTFDRLERETGFEPATSTLARSHSTAELLPLFSPDFTTVRFPACSPPSLPVSASVIPPHAARSSETSPELPLSTPPANFMPCTLPFLRMANSIDTLPFFIKGGRADCGMMRYQFSRTSSHTQARYGPRSTPRVSLSTSLPGRAEAF